MNGLEEKGIDEEIERIADLLTPSGPKIVTILALAFREMLVYYFDDW